MPTRRDQASMTIKATKQRNSYTSGRDDINLVGNIGTSGHTCVNLHNEVSKNKNPQNDIRGVTH